MLTNWLRLLKILRFHSYCSIHHISSIMKFFKCINNTVCVGGGEHFLLCFHSLVYRGSCFLIFYCIIYSTFSNLTIYFSTFQHLPFHMSFCSILLCTTLFCICSLLLYSSSPSTLVLGLPKRIVWFEADV